MISLMKARPQAKKLNLFVLFVLALPCAGHGVPLDLQAEGEFCGGVLSQDTDLKNILVPAWKKQAYSCTLEGLQAARQDNQCRPVRAVPPRYQAALRSFEEIAHDINARSLVDMQAPLYERFNAAAQVGLEIRGYQSRLNSIVQFCSQPSPSGKQLGSEALKLAQQLTDLAADRAVFSRSVVARPDAYLRRLIVAALEAKRVRALLNDITIRLREDGLADDRRAAINTTASFYVRRLLRLYYRYPALVGVGVYRGTALQVQIENLMFPSQYADLPARAVYFGDPDIEDKLAINGSGQTSEVPPKLDWIDDPSLLPGGEQSYMRLYNSILSGAKPVPQALKRRLVAAVSASVDEGLTAAQLKCQNITPCSALATRPGDVAKLIDQRGENETVGRLACACQLGQQHEWLSGKVTFDLGVASAAAVIATSAALLPASWILGVAYLLAGADSIAAGVGLDDAYLNVHRTDNVAALRTGGAVDEIGEFETNNEYAQQRFATAYNVATGLVGIIPPTKIVGRPLGSSLRAVTHNPEFRSQALIESAKAASGASAPDLLLGNYSLTYDPRRVFANMPVDVMRAYYPALAANLDRAAGFVDFAADAGARTLVLGQLKQAARVMAMSSDPRDQALLASGQIRKNLLAPWYGWAHFSFVVP